jgi:hypothetical protein
MTTAMVIISLMTKMLASIMTAMVAPSKSSPFNPDMLLL